MKSGGPGGSSLGWGKAFLNVIGLDIGGTKCTVIREDERGIPRIVGRFPTTDVHETLE